MLFSPEVLFFVALAGALYMAWNIGANDVANAFGTSVGSGALTFKRALVLAAIFEFSGAFFVGSQVADTVKGNIVDPSTFINNPSLLALGMLSALLASSLWLNIATYFGQPVSTTHAIIGAVIGFGVVSNGLGCVQWHKLGRIAASWFVSPLAGALLAFIIYMAIRRFVLKNRNPAERAKIAIPIGSAMIVSIVFFSVLHEFGGRLFSKTPPGELLAYTIGAAVVSSVIVALLVRLVVVSHVEKRDAATAEEQYALVERWFGYLQIGTACYMSFAHGANDVANAIGPLAGFMEAAKGAVTMKAQIPSWVLAVGGVGIVLGLATYGAKVMEAVGKKITEVTPTRGFSAEFGTATTVLVCSLMGLPISTTFVLVGAVMGVGLARGFGAIDLRVIRSIFASWVVTIPISAILSAAIYFALVKLCL